MAALLRSAQLVTFLLAVVILVYAIAMMFLQCRSNLILLHAHTWHQVVGSALLDTEHVIDAGED